MMNTVFFCLFACFCHLHLTSLSAQPEQYFLGLIGLCVRSWVSPFSVSQLQQSVSSSRLLKRIRKCLVCQSKDSFFFHVEEEQIQVFYITRLHRRHPFLIRIQREPPYSSAGQWTTCCRGPFAVGGCSLPLTPWLCLNVFDYQ